MTWVIASKIFLYSMAIYFGIVSAMFSIVVFGMWWHDLQNKDAKIFFTLEIMILIMAILSVFTLMYNAVKEKSCNCPDNSKTSRVINGIYDEEAKVCRIKNNDFWR